MENKINIYLCDDNRIFIEKIENEIQRILGGTYSYEITAFNNAKDLINKWNAKEADVVFLDIDMPDMNGFEAAERLQKITRNVRIVFITSHEDKVYQSWEFQPFWFVRKSHLKDLEKVLSSLIVKIDSEHREDKFRLVVDNKIVELNINEILFIHSYKHYIVVKHTSNQDVQVRCKISDIEEQLSQVHFIRIQKGMIVNCRYISKITSRDVILNNGDKIHISRDRLESVRDGFQEFVRSRM